MSDDCFKILESTDQFKKMNYSEIPFFQDSYKKYDTADFKEFIKFTRTRCELSSERNIQSHSISVSKFYELLDK